MKRAPLYWDMVYSSDRRKHSHRCWCCRKIVNDGERVFMWRATGKTTRVMHEKCAALPHVPAPQMTMRELAILQAEERRQ